ncbi:unnamed protein product [Cochlearia groenlandica]
MAVALASTSIVFNYDVSYSLKLSSGAKAMYAYAESMKDSSKGLYSADLLIWGGAWLYYAIGDLELLNRVTSHDFTNHDVVSFNTKTVGAQNNGLTQGVGSHGGLAQGVGSEGGLGQGVGSQGGLAQDDGFQGG